MKKRVLSMLMVLVMLASLLSVAAFAADETEAPSGGAETEVQPEVPEVTPEEEKAIQSFVKSLEVNDIVDELSNYFIQELRTLKEKNFKK